MSFVKSTVDSEGVTNSRLVTRTLFQTGNSYPQKKLLTFNRHTDDFSFSIHYGTNTVITDDQIRYNRNDIIMTYCVVCVTGILVQ